MPSRPPRSHAAEGWWAGRTVRACGLLLRTLCTAVALLGLLVTPPVLLLLVAPALTVSAVVLLAVMVRYCQQRWPTPPTLTRTARTTLALVPFQHGIVLLRGVGTVILLVVLALATVVSVAWLRGRHMHADSTAPPDWTADQERSLRELLQVVPLETLLAEWRTLQQHHPARRSRRLDPTAVVQARRLLLDEMQRRDPAGFAAWLAAGGQQPPDGHLHDDQGLSA